MAERSRDSDCRSGIGHSPDPLEVKSAGYTKHFITTSLPPWAIMNASYLENLSFPGPIAPMTTATTRLLTLILLILPSPSGLLAQSTTSRAARAAKNLIQPSYYKGLDLLADGQTSAAYQAFEEAYAQSRQVGQDRGIDSVPPLVMMGECLYIQGDIGASLQYLDAALNVSVQCSPWLSMLGPATPSDRSESRNKDALWSPPNGRNAAMPPSPTAWQIRLGNISELRERSPQSPSAIPSPSENNSPAGEPVFIDALEVLRCQAIALRRRAMLLGPLAKYNPLTPSLPKAFAIQPNSQPSEWIRSGASICLAIALMDASNTNEVSTQLKQRLSLSSGNDHPLTAIALLVLADLSVEANNLAAASELALESSLAAARAGQPEHVDEALELWSQCAFHNQVDYSSLGKTLLAVGKWASSNSRLVALRALVEGMRQAALRGDADTVRKQAPVVTAALLPKQILLPRMDATVAYAQAKVAFLENSLASGIQKLEESLSILRGNSPMSSASPRLYQLQLTQYLIAENALPKEIGLPLLTGLLDTERIGAWKTKSLEELVFQTADKLDARRLAVRLALETNDLELQMDAWERWKAARFSSGSALQGRLAELRRAIHALPDSVSAEEWNRWEPIRSAFPTLTKNAKTLQEWCTPFATNPKCDLRRWSDEELKRWERVTKLSAAQEALLWSAALSPLPVPETITPRWNPKSLLKTLAQNDSLLAYYSLQGDLHGYYITKSEIRSWKIENAQEIGGAVRSALQSCTTSFPSLPNDFNKQMDALRRRWIPAEVWEEMKNSERWIIAPDGELWSFPFELLSVSNSNEYEPAIAQYRICYTPTLSSLEPLIRENPLSRSERITLQSSDYWDASGGQAKSLMEQSAALMGPSRTLDLPVNGAMVPSPYIKVAAGHYSSIAPLRWDDPNRFPLVPGSDAPSHQLSGWNPLPWGTPQAVWLLGHSKSPGEIPGLIEPGDEWLRWTLPLLSQGTKHIWISRWPVGGESTLALLTPLRDNLSGTTFSEAFQRSVVTLWLEEFSPAKEPIVNRQTASGSKNSASVPGSHPAFWSGYLSIGDPTFGELKP